MSDMGSKLSKLVARVIGSELRTGAGDESANPSGRSNDKHDTNSVQEDSSLPNEGGNTRQNEKSPSMADFSSEVSDNDVTTQSRLNSDGARISPDVLTSDEPKKSATVSDFLRIAGERGCGDPNGTQASNGGAAICDSLSNDSNKSETVADLMVPSDTGLEAQLHPATQCAGTVSSTPLVGDEENKSETVADFFRERNTDRTVVLDFGDEKLLRKKYGETLHELGTQLGAFVMANSVTALAVGKILTEAWIAFGGRGRQSRFAAFLKIYAPDLSDRTARKWRHIWGKLGTRYEEHQQAFRNCSLTALYELLDRNAESSDYHKVLEIAKTQSVTKADVKKIVPKRRDANSVTPPKERSRKNLGSTVNASVSAPKVSIASDAPIESMQRDDKSAQAPRESEERPEARAACRVENEPPLDSDASIQGHAQQAITENPTEGGERGNCEEVEHSRQNADAVAVSETPSAKMRERYENNAIEASLHLLCCNKDLAAAIRHLEARGFTYHSVHLGLITETDGELTLGFLVNGGSAPDVDGYDCWFKADRRKPNEQGTMATDMRNRVDVLWPSNSIFEVFNGNGGA